MLKANFNITESGGTGIVQLQSSSDLGATWQSVGGLLTLSGGALTVDDSTDVEINPTVFLSGVSYMFRLTDAAGTPVSHVVDYTMPLQSITGYSAGQATIDVVSTGGANYDITYHITPAAFQTLASGVTVASVDWAYNLIQGGAPTTQESGNSTTDHTKSITAAAGIYVLNAQYNLSDGSTFQIVRTIKMDGSGTILGDIQRNGLTINNVSGLTIDVTAHVIQSGVSESVFIASVANNAPLTLATSLSYAGAIAGDVQEIALYTSIDPTFWSDLPGGLPPYAFSSLSGITIS